MTWNTYPTSIENLSDVNYLFAIDENGTSTLSHNFNEENMWFTVTGVLYNLENFEETRDRVINLKNKYWEKGLFKGKRIVLHSKDIRKKVGPFNPKLVNSEEFTQDLNLIIDNIDAKIYSSSINKLEHCSQYSSPFPVYELGVEFMLERFCLDIMREEKSVAILLESRGFKENLEVLNKINYLLGNGNEYRKKHNFSCIKGVYFNPKRTRDGSLSYWPLELCDIISYSIHKYVKTEEVDDHFEYVEKKIHKYPNYNGKGLKIFP
ncbi:hypothetical protein [Marinilactibacillus sp. Marseille-P9653]|uniref:DUF3800 domain-containing protein n=1 Tax=Marinilactibacillus sp. Marseille-P9653 TaxID=2866583 RepID=UPI001CE46305|nr:hypothetical protein [Marinilactibacillus sp. Marseille-P9653]